MSILNDKKIATREFVLCALYNASRPVGMGFLSAIGSHSILTDVEAKGLLEEAGKDKHHIYFDYLYGRPLKTGFPRNNEAILGMDFFLFERDNGPVERALEMELERRT